MCKGFWVHSSQAAIHHGGKRDKVSVNNPFISFSQLIGFSPTLFVWSKIYAPNNLSGKYFKLVETFLIVVVSQNVFSAEIDKPFFYKVFQLAPGVVVLQRNSALVGGGIPHN